MMSWPLPTLCHSLRQCHPKHPLPSCTFTMCSDDKSKSKFRLWQQSKNNAPKIRYVAKFQRRLLESWQNAEIAVHEAF